MKKFVMIFLVMMVMLSASALAFEYEGVVCSTDPTDYVYFNDAVVLNASAHNYLNYDPLLQADNAVFTSFIDNLTFASASGRPSISTEDPTGASQVSLQLAEATWKIHDGSLTDTGFDVNIGTSYNVSVIFDMSVDTKNITFSNNTDFDVTTNFGFRNVVDVGRTDFEVGAGATTVNGYYVWNGTSCPAEPINPVATISSIFNSPTDETNNETFSLFVEDFNLTGASSVNLIYNSTNYTTDINLVNNSYVEFNTSLITPLIEVNNTGVSFYWEYNLEHENFTATRDLTAPESQTLHWKYFVSAENYPDSISLATANFAFNASVKTPAVINYAAVEFNRTANYTATSAGNLWTAAVSIPEISGFSEDFNVTGYINVTYDGQDFIRQGDVLVQTTYGVGLFTCESTPLTNQTSLNITLFDEETLGEVVGDIEVAFTLNSSDSTTQFNTSFSLTGASNYGLCIYPEDAVLFGDAYFEYSAPSYDTRLYYLLDTLYTNESNDLSLYLINSSTPSDVSLYVFDTAGVPVPGAYINVQRYYPATSTYSLIETVLTDVNGLAIASLDLNDVTYKFAIDVAGSTVYTSGGSPVYSTELYFYVSLEDVTSSILLGENYVNYYVNYSNVTDLFTFFFDDSSGNVVTGCLEIYHSTTQGEALINETCVDSSTATITYLLNQSAGTFVGKGYVYYDSGKVFLQQITATMGGLYKTLGSYGTLLSIIVIGTIAFAGMFMAEAMIVFTAIGVVAAYFMGLTFLSIEILIALVILAGIILFKRAR